MQSQITSVLRDNEDYNIQVSKETEGKVTKKLSQEINRTESCILGALSSLDNFLLNPPIRTLCGPVPEIFRNADAENQETGNKQGSFPE